MRDVNYGWLLRYLHANGASFFFILVYAHIGRGLYYGSFKAPRVAPWSVGVIMLVLMMAIAFLGALCSLRQTSVCSQWVDIRPTGDVDSNGQQNIFKTVDPCDRY